MGENCTENVWVYDLRTNMPSFGKRTPFGEQYLKPFEDCYHAAERQESHGQISPDGNGKTGTVSMRPACRSRMCWPPKR